MLRRAEGRARQLQAAEPPQNQLKRSLAAPSLADAELMPGCKLDYDRAVKEAISGRYLLDIKRSGAWKARGVKQGFKEDKTQADGPGFQITTWKSPP